MYLQRREMGHRPLVCLCTYQSLHPHLIIGMCHWTICLEGCVQLAGTASSLLARACGGASFRIAPPAEPD